MNGMTLSGRVTSQGWKLHRNLMTNARNFGKLLLLLKLRILKEAKFAVM